MEGRGLVVRTGHPSDRRGTIVHITGPGMQVIRRAAPGHAAVVRRYFVDLLTEPEIETMTSICRRVSAVAEGQTPS
jgi:DNA-binding MarR family transcriptional regulator